VRVAAHVGNPPMNCRIRQTATASPAKPGDLPRMLGRCGDGHSCLGSSLACPGRRGGRNRLARLSLSRLKVPVTALVQPRCRLGWPPRSGRHNSSWLESCALTAVELQLMKDCMYRSEILQLFIQPAMSRKSYGFTRVPPERSGRRRSEPPKGSRRNGGGNSG
jgi:hypothetical protein